MNVLRNGVQFPFALTDVRGRCNTNGTGYIAFTRYDNCTRTELTFTPVPDEPGQMKLYLNDGRAVKPSLIARAVLHYCMTARTRDIDWRLDHTVFVVYDERFDRVRLAA